MRAGAVQRDRRRRCGSTARRSSARSRASIQVKDYDEALVTANDTAFGLSAGIATTSLKHATHFKRHCQAGMVMVNLPTAGVDYHVPFGGRKGSSYGPGNRAAAQEFFTVVKTAYTDAELIRSDSAPALDIEALVRHWRSPRHARARAGRRKVGAVLVLADEATTLAACNDFPPGSAISRLATRIPSDCCGSSMPSATPIFAAARSGLATAGAHADRHLPSVCRLRPRDRPGRNRHLVHAGAGLRRSALGPRLSVLAGSILEEGGVRVVCLERDPALMHVLTLGLNLSIVKRH